MKKLSKDAFGGVAGKDYVPYVADKPKKAGSPIIMILGILLAALFAASTAYSGMKAGLTVAAGIPGAIIGSGLVALFVKPKTILGKNLLQLMSSGGESVASGMIFVLPAVILVGGKVNFIEGVGLGIGAVLLGVGVFSIVQDYMLVSEHGKLVYPEAMAISETLVASDTGGDSLKYMGIGFGIGGILTALTGSVFGIMNNVISYVNESFYKWKFETEVNPLLAGIGFIVGMDVSVLMFAGSILANFAIAPLLGYFMEMANSNAHVWDNASQLLSASNFAVISGSYVKYIGAGMMISGGLIGAIKLIPTIISSISATMKGRKDGVGRWRYVAVDRWCCCRYRNGLRYHWKCCNGTCWWFVVNYLKLPIRYRCRSFDWYDRYLKLTSIWYDDCVNGYLNISLCNDGLDFS